MPLFSESALALGLHQQMAKNASLISIAVSGIITALLGLLLWSGIAPQLAILCGGHLPLDLVPAFTTDSAYQTFVSCSTAGRIVYVIYVGFDFMFAASTGLFLALTMAFCLCKRFSDSHFMLKVTYVPLFSAYCGWMANLLVLVLDGITPMRANWIASLAMFVGLVERGALYASVGLLAIAVLIGVFGKKHA
eukprot:TRINITY_DN15170_c0_g1_i1.p1 TRINITY_DN15170_c0_g1~~TRINITY_DN15170_c0_g1_i1.p1  ORF type:complete len:192 (-),score=31.28 TRINITY_DN15170_c0_g1_i1:184-759(-)